MKTHHYNCAAVQFANPEAMGLCNCAPGKRERDLNSLRSLLAHPTLGDVGMASLKGVLAGLLPDL